MEMQNSSTKHWQTKPSNILNRLYTRSVEFNLENEDALTQEINLYCNRLHRCRKIIGKISTTSHGKNTLKAKTWVALSQPDEGRLWKFKYGITLNHETQNTFPLRPGTRQGSLFSLLLFNLVLDVLSRAVSQKIIYNAYCGERK